MFCLQFKIGTMSTAVDRLLEAARFLELQEMHQRQQVVCTPPDSPVTTGGHYMIHSSNDYQSINSAFVKIEGNIGK